MVDYFLKKMSVTVINYPAYYPNIISWIINYGHTHLLQEIVNHVERKHHNTSLVFGSNVRENTRLLLLGCYSETLDMVELILKYVDPKCIDMDFTSSNSRDKRSYEIKSNIS
jgi:hypothetical protein